MVRPVEARYREFRYGQSGCGEVRQARFATVWHGKFMRGESWQARIGLALSRTVRCGRLCFVRSRFCLADVAGHGTARLVVVGRGNCGAAGMVRSVELRYCDVSCGMAGEVRPCAFGCGISWRVMAH